MYLTRLELHDFRNYTQAGLDLAPGITVLLGRNGQGKTNLVEAAGYLASLGSHRVANDGPLVRFGADQAVLRGVVRRDDRELLVELEINPGRSNRARLNRAPMSRPRDVLGALRTVVFAPEDLALVKGDPSERRNFLDNLLVAELPRWAGVRADYDKVVRQRNALLKSALPVMRPGARRGPRSGMPGGAGESVADQRAAVLHTLDVWDEQLVRYGGQLLHGRLGLVDRLGPHVARSYDAVSDSDSQAVLRYRASLAEPDAARLLAGEVPALDEVQDMLRRALAEQRDAELDRGVGLVGPHRDELVLSFGEMPVKGYASHGESWSFALGLRLASFALLRESLDTDPVLILDDVFAELDAGRRERLADLVADAEQVLITAAVVADVPEQLTHGQVLGIDGGQVVADVTSGNSGD